MTSVSQIKEFQNEPILDFSITQNIERYKAALKNVKEKFPLSAPVIVNNQTIETSDKITLPSPNDLDIEVGTSMLANEEITKQSILSAKKAYYEWSRTPVIKRADFLRKVAIGLTAKKFELSALIVYEAGKPWREADADVSEAIDFLNYYAGEIESLKDPIPLQKNIIGETNELYYAPLGIVGVIGPWNFPIAIPVGMMAAALAAGNTVILKPAEQTPLIIFEVMQEMIKCGLPPGVVNYLPGKGEIVGKLLVESPEVQMIAFTGSREVGTQIIKQCASLNSGQKFLKRVVAEMGGKNAIIVDSSADLDHSIPDIIYSAFGFSGQKCSACSRLIVLENIYDSIVKKLKEAMESLKICSALDPGCEVGPLIDQAAKEKVEAYIKLGFEKHKPIFVSDIAELKNKGHYVPVAAFEVNDPNAEIAQQEIFGTVLSVLKAKDFEDALKIANNSDYALTGGVMSRTPRHLEIAKHELQCGNLYLNRSITGAIVGRQPFGGYKLSGIGSKAGGPDYLKQFLVARTATENIMRKGTAPLN